MYMAIQERAEKLDLEYADNFRWYRKDNSENLDEFKERERNGCCGFYTGEVTIDGIEYVIGCNYGH